VAVRKAEFMKKSGRGKGRRRKKRGWDFSIRPCGKRKIGARRSAGTLDQKRYRLHRAEITTCADGRLRNYWCSLTIFLRK
jgi:hypothetical protein